ncbi:MAG: S8 family peptidase, partial [Alphaproteobacteria bacterium]|nr:S8 family peptidase [Alphaproteobacteria bacterium]
MKIGKSGVKIEGNDLVVYITADKQEAFFEKAEEHLDGDSEYNTPIERVPKNNELIDGIEELQKALLVKSFWTDDKRLIPSSQQEWCEVWLRGDSEDVIVKFDKLLQSQNIDSKTGYIKFPERLVKLISASEEQLSNITRNSDDIAEYRRAKTTAEFLLSQTPADQSEWVDDLLGRLSVDNSSNVSVCILDTGVNNGHPLLNPVLSDNDCQAVEPDWGSHDHDSHGTLMAGLVAYGDLQSKLESSDPVNLGHILESVKILPPDGNNKVELYGYITKQAISRAEVQANSRNRIACMAISSDDTRDRGRPSSWSAAIDQITSGAEDEDKRLFILAAGNANESKIIDYPQAQKDDSIADPAQSWNSITVGAFTELTKLTDTTYKGYSTLAEEGEISPFSTTSLTWENNKWPIKPDVVFEGGNATTDNSGLVEDKSNDLSLISTNYKPQEEPLTLFNKTSAATAQAANFAAQIQVQYPDYWPETVRALMIHSAEWPQALKEQFAQNDNKTELNNVLRACGYGVPSLEKAIYCASNSLTLIAEAEIQPFEKKGGKYKTKDMHLYELPWPKEILETLGEIDVEMRVTLSYFVEPGPGEIGWKDRYRYA